MQDRTNKSWFFYLTLTLFAAIALFATSCSSDNESGSSTTTADSIPEATVGSRVGLSAQSASPDSFADLVEDVRPAVVQITTQQIQLDQARQPYSVPAGVGTGVIYHDSGLIITNNHVIEGGQELLVSLTDGRTFTAELVGGDARNDLAVIKIDGRNLPLADFGDSSKVRVGDWVIAIGNALGLPGGPTVTEGVASAVDRTVQEPVEPGGSGPFLFDLIQTSAPINPGNSGGPLVNLNGEVIGINTLVIAQAGPGVPAQGLGFAISSNRARSIADELVKNGRVEHAYLGINYVPLSPSIAAQLGTTERKGIAVAAVEPGSPAAQAGIQARDVITAINGQVLETESTLAQKLAEHDPGDTVQLTVVRGDQKRDVQVRLGSAPE